MQEIPWEIRYKQHLFDDYLPCWKEPVCPPPVNGHYWDCKCEDHA